MKNIRGFWWKILGVIIFCYVLIGGLLVPLKSGITAVNPSNSSFGDTIELNIVGYNTHFLTATSHRSWLKLDSIHFVQSVSIKSQSENEARVKFYLPSSIPYKENVLPLTLIMDNELDGPFLLPNALFVSSNGATTIDPLPWTTSKMDKLHTTKGIKFPYRNILNETIRNTFFHVSLWFAMFILLIAGLFHAIQYLRTKDFRHDINSAAYNKIAILYGILGLITGSVWAKFTWNTFWTTDIKLNMTAIAMLIYFAYLILRGSSQDVDRKAKLSAAYSIFAFLALIPLVFVIPRLTDSLHPGNGGNPALGGEDLDHTLRIFFYPSIIALILIGTWMSELLIRYEKIKEYIFLKNR
jgi:heme exporter protein C